MGKNKDNWHKLYTYMEPKAENVKIVLQMLIGVVIVVFILWKLALNVGLEPTLGNISDYIKWTGFLAIVANGLGVSAGIELAYMLFTPGPDEAVDPLLMGLSSTALLLISQAKELTWQFGLGVLLIAFAIAVLFYIRPKVNKT